MTDCVRDLGNGYYSIFGAVDADNPNPECDFILVPPREYELLVSLSVGGSDSSVPLSGQSTLTQTDVSLLFSAAATLYALVFVFKLALKQMGY
ncbi:hypothetical protein Sps_00934 [Shewanella psychrophila]|uniref:Uncharacterized protein n=1 Tax=Shewanella psychrophila TaxID=225848 RepID=A0A1S6HKT6_9GAMM|nr:hypothetical protein [Shewanella psychrophila]AQS36123.1 hypothetical protein Sps_00934 [Shewanella psychrophila]